MEYARTGSTDTQRTIDDVGVLLIVLVSGMIGYRKRASPAASLEKDASQPGISGRTPLLSCSCTSPRRTLICIK